MKFVVDRTENGIAVVQNENGETFNLPQQFLKAFKEGESFELVKTDNTEIKEQLKSRLDNLFERGTKND